MVTGSNKRITGCRKPLRSGEAIAYKDRTTNFAYADGHWIVGEYLSEIGDILQLYPTCGSGGTYQVICQECSVAAGLEW
jgi:prepilin-type processing-associated H-X9-DG protein